MSGWSQALYAEGRYNDANTYVSRLGAEHAAAGIAESLAIALAVKENRIKEALSLAKQAVDRNPKVPMHHISLAKVLVALDGQLQRTGGSIFQDSTQRFPKDMGVWNSLFSYLVQTKQKEKARVALERWSEQVGANESSKQYILAQGYELLGDIRRRQECTEQPSRPIQITSMRG